MWNTKPLPPSLDLLPSPPPSHSRTVLQQCRWAWISLNTLFLFSQLCLCTCAPCGLEYAFLFETNTYPSFKSQLRDHLLYKILFNCPLATSCNLSSLYGTLCTSFYEYIYYCNFFLYQISRSLRAGITVNSSDAQSTFANWLNATHSQTSQISSPSRKNTAMTSDTFFLFHH